MKSKPTLTIANWLNSTTHIFVITKWENYRMNSGNYEMNLCAETLTEQYEPGTGEIIQSIENAYFPVIERERCHHFHHCRLEKTLLKQSSAIILQRRTLRAFEVDHFQVWTYTNFQDDSCHFYCWQFFNFSRRSNTLEFSLKCLT